MPLHILIIDEDRALCEALSNFLTGEGHTVTCAYAGKEGLDAARAESPDLILLELVLPEIGGFEIMRRLERLTETQHIPVIAVSGHTELEYELLNVIDFIPKPVDMARLAEDIEIVRRGGKKGRPAKTATLPKPDYYAFYEYLLAHTGLHFDQRNVKLLERGLLSRMTALKIGSYREYFDYLLRYQESRQELNKLLQFLTVGETYFFRYHSHFDALRNTIIPELAELRLKEGVKSLRFWSAGCSTGEEPYSIAMTVMEALPDWRDWDIRILATDINNRALRRAREGAYGPRALRVTEKGYLERYFDQVDGSWRVKEEVKRLVDFAYLNLQTGEFPGGLDTIFCRNVMIYFNLPTTIEIVKRFSASLNPGGHLFLGHSETLLQISADFERVARYGGFYYRKKGEGAPLPPQERKPVKERKPARTPPAREEPAPANVIPLPSPPAAAPITAGDPEGIYSRAVSLFVAEDYPAAADLLKEVIRRKPGHTGALVMQGFVLANRGLFEEALKVCGAAIALDDLLPEVYFLKGLVLDMADRPGDALEEYRKALLLDMDFVMPHYNLGKLYFRLGREKEGVRELRNCSKLLEKCAEGCIIPHSGGLSREVFLEVLRSELAGAVQGG